MRSIRENLWLWDSQGRHWQNNVEEAKEIEAKQLTFTMQVQDFNINFPNMIIVDLDIYNIQNK